MKQDKSINAKLLEAIFKVIPEKELEKSGDFWQEVTDGLQKKLTQLFEAGNRLNDLKEAGVIEKAFRLPKRGGTGRDKDKLVARTEEEQMILRQAKEAFTLSDYFYSEYEKINELRKLLDEFLPFVPLKNGLSNMPQGSAIKAIIDVIDAGQDGEQGIKEMPKRKSKISHTKYTVTQGDLFNENEGKMIIRHELSKGHGYISLKISNSIANNELYGYSVATKKILTLILEKINEQAYSNGELIRDYVTFSNDELIERGIYKTPQSALKGMKIALNILTDMKMEGMLSFNKSKPISYSMPASYQYGNIFRFGTYKNGQWGIYIEAKANWRFIFQAFSILPDYYYSLPNRPSELLYLIFATARQHTDDIKKRGYFCIGLRKIQEALHLPEEDRTKNPQRDIKDVINTAIKEIDEAQIKYYGNEELLFLSLEYDDNWNIRQFLDEGFLHVSLSDFFAKPFIDVEDDKIKNMKKARRKKQKALETGNKSENKTEATTKKADEH